MRASSKAIGCCAVLAFARCEAERCGDDACFVSAREWTELSRLSGLSDPPLDRSNKYDGDPAAAALGQKFFFDPHFAGFSTQVDRLDRLRPYARAPRGQPILVACSTCHDLGSAGVDRTSAPNHVSIGAGWHYLNATPMVNVAHWQLFSITGRADSLWAQGVAIISGSALGSNRLRVARRVAAAYRVEYEAVFSASPLPACLLEPTCFPSDGDPGKKPGCQAGDPSEPFADAFDCLSAEDQDAVTRVCVNWAKATAAFERGLRSADSRFDRFIAAGPRSQLLSPSELRGAKLFVGKANCVDCHSGPLLTDQRFHNIGVPQVGVAVPTEAECPAGAVCDCVNGRNCLPWGEYEGLQRLKSDRFRRDSKWSDDQTDDSRAADYAREPAEEMKGRWRTPSLRDVALTAPYMHDGLYPTLERVIWHYNQGGVVSGPYAGTIDSQIAPLALNEEEQADLVAFLSTLTGAPLPPEIARAPVLPP